MVYFVVSLSYSVINLLLAIIILLKSRRSLLSKFYGFCVSTLILLGATGFFYNHPSMVHFRVLISQISAFLYAVFPFFFLHFMLIFIRRYEVLKSRAIILMTYFAGLFSYVVVLLGFIANPFITSSAITVGGHIYYLTWMSILFSVGVALLYSLIGGFSERGLKTNLLFTVFVLVMLLLPTPFTLSVFSAVLEDSFIWYTISSTMALAIVVFFVFRHRITMNTPYQAMRSALAAMNDLLVKTDEHFIIEMVQGRVDQLLGYEEKDLVGKMFYDLLAKRDGLEGYRLATLTENKVRQGYFTLDVLGKTGDVLTMDFSFTPVLASEDIIGFVGVGRNVTERRRAETALIESESRYRLLAENSTDLISVLTPAGLFEYTSPACRTLLGYEPVELTGHSLFEFVHPDDLDGLRSVFARIRGDAGIVTVAYRMRKMVGEYIWFETTCRHLECSTTGDIHAITAVSRDITSRRKAEQDLRESEERYRRFFEDDLTGDFTVTPDGEILDCNHAFAKIFGFTSVRRVLHSNIGELYPSCDAFSRTVRLLRERGKLEYYETELRRLDGQPLFIVENIIGEFGASGELRGIKGYIFDNTERKRLEDSLRQAQKLENLGTLAGGIAHDFNNILGILKIHAEILGHPRLSREKFRRSLDVVSDTVKRGSGLVRQLLTFARKTETLFEPVDIAVILGEIKEILRSTFPRTIVFRNEIPSSLPVISADPNQIHQALLNLCVNARDAMPEGGILTLAAELVDGRTVGQKIPEARAERYLRIRVADTGSGMDNATRGRIFEPFFTTKEKGKGTGLGLAVVYGVMKSHQGFVDVESRLGEGTCFSLYIPIPEKNKEMAPLEHTAAKTISGGSETILFVEDEQALADTVKELLEEKGYHVITASNGEEAVSMYMQGWRKIALVISDMDLPKLNGWHVAMVMKGINPNVKLIFASGRIDPEIRQKITESGIRHIIQKPYVIADVLRMVREVMDNHQT